jgi:hypothetical protein
MILRPIRSGTIVVPTPVAAANTQMKKMKAATLVLKKGGM